MRAVGNDGYGELLARKVERQSPSGFEPKFENSMLFPWQREIVRRAVRAGRYAVFADCGMGKTAMQLCWAEEVCRHTGGAVLVIAPLSVAPQTVEEGAKFGIRVEQVREMPESPRGTYVTNYEMLDRFDVAAFDGVVLDESSILKSYTGKTKRALVESCGPVRYRLSCTATPSPNDLMELLNQAEFLGVMKSSEALSVWFVNDQSEAGKYRLKGHAARDFWAWVASWCTAVSSPSDMGYPADGFELPPIEELDCSVRSALDPSEGEGRLFHLPELSATSFHREKRRSLGDRCEAAAEIARRHAEAGEQVLVWCYLNDEADLLKSLLPGADEVRGSDSPERKEAAACAFRDGTTRVLISKPSIFGFGMNFQSCHVEVFCGLDYSFESYYQAVRRVYRYGQTEPVRIYRVVGESELAILDAIGRKADAHAAAKDSIARAVASAGSASFSVSGSRSDFGRAPFLVSKGA